MRPSVTDDGVMKEHKIRMALAGLKGKVREETKLKLLMYPGLVEKNQSLHIHHPPSKRARKLRPTAKRKEVNFSMRLTYEEYKELKSRAKEFNMSMSKYVVWECDLG